MNGIKVGTWSIRGRLVFELRAFQGPTSTCIDRNAYFWTPLLSWPYLKFACVCRCFGKINTWSCVVFEALFSVPIIGANISSTRQAGNDVRQIRAREILHLAFNAAGAESSSIFILLKDFTEGNAQTYKPAPARFSFISFLSKRRQQWLG